MERQNKLDTIKDHSGIQHFEYGRMGEVTKMERIIALPCKTRRKNEITCTNIRTKEKKQ